MAVLCHLWRFQLYYQLGQYEAIRVESPSRGLRGGQCTDRHGESQPGSLLVGLGELEEAERLLRSARRYYVKRYSEESWQIVEVEIFLSHLQARQGEKDEALARAAASLETVRAAKGDDHWLTRLVRLMQSRL